MDKEEFRKLEIGDLVYLFKLEISLHYHVNLGIAAELKKIGNSEFKVLRVLNGKTLRPGEEVTIDDTNWRSRYKEYNLFGKLEDGVEWWNSKIRNADDGLTSEYEKKKRTLNKRLIKI